MKTIFSALAGVLFSLGCFAQLPPCCMPPAKGSGMTAMMSTRAFAEAHAAPEPMSFASDRGSMIRFETLDGHPANAYYVPAPAATDKVLILFHEWWGLNDYIKREAVRWQDLLGNVDVYAVDLYDGKVAATQPEAQRLSTGLDKRRTDNILKGMLAKVGKDRIIATLGWCLGGGYAFTATTMAGQQAHGCVMYYGFPEKDPKKVAQLKTDVLYIYGTQDQFITDDMVRGFQEAVSAAGRHITRQDYPAAHAFANPSNPKHDAAAAARAEEQAVAFLKTQLVLE